jgi:N-formylglutamate deformylase
MTPYTLRLPTVNAVPLVCDSPHSGECYPADFGCALAFEHLRAGEDTDVHVLWDALPGVGATLLAAEFPRSYIDPNRDVGDIDPDMLAAPWPGPVNASEKTRLGIGLFWRVAGHGERQPIYDRKLSVAEAQARIAHYHAPYHAALQAQLESAHRHFGAVWHLNLHSMPANAYEGLQIRTAKRRRGLSVALNDPFKGVALIARLGRPAERRHSLQVELHRGLYMDEATRARSAGFEPLQRLLAEVATEIAAYVRVQTQEGHR